MDGLKNVVVEEFGRGMVKAVVVVLVIELGKVKQMVQNEEH